MDDQLSHLLRARILHSERLRAAALLAIAILFVIVIAVLANVPGLLPPGKESLYAPALKPMAAVLAAMALYQGAVLLLLGRWQRQGKSIPGPLHLVNALVEILVPTLMMWDFARVAGPLQIIGGVLPWLYFPLIAASVLHLSPRLCWFSGALSAVCFAGVAVLITRGQSMADAPLMTSTTAYGLKGLMMLVCGGTAAFVAGQMKAYLHSAVQSAQERDRALGIFGQHVSPQVARRLIEQPAEFAAEQRHVCVLFLDIRGFSSLAATRTPAEVMDYLNRLFAPMITIVNRHGGIVNKFLGDGFMAIFGAPFEDPELHRNAVNCSLALLDSVEQLNAAQAIPPTRIGIGLHAGNAMAGTVGSDERKEYTLLGDTVNAAARIEQETKRLEARVIVSSDVLEGLPEEKAKATDLGELALRGIARPLRLYRLA